MAEQTGQSGRSTFEEFGRKVDAHMGSFAPKMEDEVRRVIAYLNDQVVPQVRRESSTALRAAAEQLSRLAERLEQNRAAAGQAPASQSSEAHPGE
jgi:hypothetical protein